MFYQPIMATDFLNLVRRQSPDLRVVELAAVKYVFTQDDGRKRATREIAPDRLGIDP